MQSRESGILRIFVGEGEYPEQNAHAKYCRDNGWVMGRHTKSPEILDAVARSGDKIVVLHGSDANACIPILMQRILLQNPIFLIVPLHRVKRCLEYPDPYMSRATAIADWLYGDNLLFDPRLIVTPRSVWKKAQQMTVDGVDMRYTYFPIVG